MLEQEKIDLIIKEINNSKNILTSTGKKVTHDDVFCVSKDSFSIKQGYIIKMVYCTKQEKIDYRIKKINNSM